MKEIKDAIHQALDENLREAGFDVDLVAIPSRGDRMVRMRTLEEALEDFDTDRGEARGYLIQIRPRTAPAAAGPAQPLPGAAPEEPQIYTQLMEETFAQADRMAGKKASREDVEFLLQNAQVLFKSGDYPLAKNIYRAVLRSGQRSGLALFWLGRCAEAEGKLEDARICYGESITFEPALDTFQHLAALLIRRKQDLEAARCLERAAQLKDLPTQSRFELHKAAGNCWMRAEKPEEAASHYRKAIELDSSADGIHANLAALKLHTGDIDAASGHFRDALAINPRNDKALAGLGSCLLARGEKRQAHDHFAQALDLSIQNPTAIYYLVKCAYEIKSYATAARLVGQYVQVAPVNANLLFSLGGLQFHLGRIEEARATTERCLELQPEHSGAGELKKMIDRYGGRAG